MSKISTWQALRNKFPESEYVLISEVADNMGYGKSRSLDHMVINLWPSRGLSILGIELKSNRGDWLKELKTPEKQENHFKYCDFFYLLTDKENVAKIEEIPTTWGWYHFTGSVIKTMKEAPKLESVPVSRSFLCAMLRRAACKKDFVHKGSLEDAITEKAAGLDRERNFTLERKAQAHDEVMQKIKAFKEASGIDILDFYFEREIKKLGEAAKLIMSGDLKTYVENLQRIEGQVRGIYEGLQKKVSGLSQLIVERHEESTN